MSTSCGATRADRRVGMPAPWLDRLAIGASFACLVHCLVLPMVIAASPTLASVLDMPEALHVWAFALALPVSALAMARGFRRHGLWLPAALGAGGLMLLGVGVLAGLAASLETGLTLAGSAVLALAHVRNWQLRAASASAATLQPSDVGFGRGIHQESNLQGNSQ